MADQGEERAQVTGEPAAGAAGGNAGGPGEEAGQAREPSGAASTVPAAGSAEAAGEAPPGTAGAGEAETPEGARAPEAGQDADGEALRQALAEAQARCEQAEAARQQIWDQFLRLQADFDNFRKRTQRERAEWQERGMEELIRQLLPVVDNLERALASVPADGLTPGSAAQGLVAGVRMVYDQLRSVLEQAGLQPVEAVGQAFDPRYHEAIERVSAPGYEPDTVVEELQRGYLFRSKLIRPSLVRVAQAGDGQLSDGEGGNNVG